MQPVPSNGCPVKAGKEKAHIYIQETKLRKNEVHNAAVRDT